jgi:bifunctional DNA-binding transcriptional regulator/antitoxin component of YhaV-PrlF toxin-antitoxin module
MRTSVDRVGRLVIPRELRRRVGLMDGGEVELQLDGAAIRVEPIAGTELIEEEGLMIVPATGSTFGHELVGGLIDEDRDTRG